MRVDVHLHTTLQRQTESGPLRQLALDLPPGASVQDALQALDIQLSGDDLILALNHRVAGAETPLAEGDRLDVIPAISGG